ncbi:hypothetical protein D0T53_10940 [Dysgonomonas sp. 216]|uniref:hypothetical protein n=1 Tax=Dysgonomonas sp. 216 TaxID=2302934 RepID=UPI0013D717E9|nr:hypothetical protein [Dysgonomonas sp. 216]NDW19420.1 hypothetical protein [Dysgonomonas sp. 216]
MTILEDIVNKYNQKKGANSFLPINEQDLDTQADVSPIAPEIKNEQTAQENKEAESSNAMPTVKYPNKPESMSDGDYEHLMSVGFSPEAISSYTKPYDPSTNGNYLQRIFEDSVPKPTAPDEKKMRGARIVSGIGDALGLISQMVSAGKGAYMKERDYNSSALAQTAAKEKELSNIYLQQQNKYNEGFHNARLKDFLMGLENHNRERKELQDILTNKHKIYEAKRQFNEKMEYNKSEQDRKQTNADRDFDLKRQNTESQIDQRKASVAQGWARVADARNRTSAYVKKMSSGSGANSSYQMIIEANPQDNQAQTDEQLGGKFRMFEMNKGEVDYNSRAALLDTEFLKEYPQFDRKPGILGEAPKAFTEKERTDISAAYIKYRYDKQFENASQYQYPVYNPTPQWGNNYDFLQPDYDSDNVEDDEWGQFEISGF